MKQILSRRRFLATLFSTAALPSAAQTTAKTVQAPIPSLGQILAGFGVSGTHSIVVMDVDTGRVLEGSDQQRAMIPASVTKAVTTLYALRTLGSAHRFQTRLVGSGKVVGGVLRGDLTLVGGGDPALDTDGLAALVAGLRGHGIKSVAGKFQIYSGALPYQRVTDKEQPDYVGYNPTISGMNLNFNRVFFQWRRGNGGYDLDLIAKGKNFSPDVSGIRMRAVNRDVPVYEYKSSGGRDTWTVAARALGKGGSRWLPVRNPANYTAEVFRALAAEQGINLPAARSAKSIPKGLVLAQQTGAELSRLTRAMLKYSTNITAEVVGLRTSVKRGKVKTLAQSGAMMSTWARKNYGVKSAKFVDHSGLGASSRITAEDMATILRREGFNGPLRPLLKEVGLRNAAWKSAPIAGLDIVAKTGTLNFASALAGYMDCPNGRKLAFAVFTADERARGSIPAHKRERADGAKGWARKSRILQHQLIARWARVYGS